VHCRPGSHRLGSHRLDSRRPGRAGVTITLPGILVVLLASALCAVVTYHLWLARGGSPLQALGACGTAGAAVFGIGMTLLNTVS